MADTPFQRKIRELSISVPWNPALITIGSRIIAFAVKAAILPHELLSGGMSGAGLPACCIFGGLTPGQWYWALNIPLFALGRVFMRRRFFFYSLYVMAAVGLFIDMITIAPKAFTIIGETANVLGEGFSRRKAY